MRWFGIAGAAVLGLLGLAGLGIAAAGHGGLGEVGRAGVAIDTARTTFELNERRPAQAKAENALGSVHQKQILFGDLHVHTSFSTDAMTMGLPLSGGSGSHTVADACDVARFCSSPDFWTINDHAESSTPRRWQETVDAIRQCDAVSGAGNTADNTAEQGADLLSFLGWEWSHMGTTPSN